MVDTAIADAHAGRLILDDASVLDLAAALTIPGSGTARSAAQPGRRPRRRSSCGRRWCARLPDPEAAEPAALLAVSALLRGDGALANVALDRAERAWPGHRLTRMLRAVADTGIRPAELRACLRPDVAGRGDGSPGGRRRTTRRRRRTG